MKTRMFKRIGIIIAASGILFVSSSFRSDFFEIAKQIEIFTTLFKELNMNYVDETNPAQLMDTAIKAMLEDLDPYTNYWNEQDVEAARINNSGEYNGVGAAVRIGKENIIITEVFKGFPADKAGLKAGDEITHIGEIRVSDFKENAGELLNGSPNSNVELTYKRQNKTNTTTLTRGSVELKAVPYYTMLENNTGYIVLSRFNSKASEETIRALKDLKNQGAEKLILDLRNNPGGLLSEAINITNIFVKKGQLITSTKSAIEKYNEEYYTLNEPVDTQIPIAVIINGRSASASEIVAGAIQDLDRGVVVGARSFGKGLVQRPKKLAYGTQLKMTISRYYTPSGRCIQALNYRERDEMGNALRTSEANYNQFKTKNGRIVYDGGGILPDIDLETAAYSEITNALLAKQAIFNYATNYYYANELEKPGDFTFTDKDFQDFKNYLNQINFSYQTASEMELQKFYEEAENEKFTSKITSEINSIKSKIEEQKKSELEDKKPEIISVLTDEIVKRFHYEEGLYVYYTTQNPEIIKSLTILNQPTEYQKILN